MNINLQEYASLCEWAPTSWLIISDNVFDPLIYYSHIVPVLLALPLAFIIYFNNRERRQNQLFFLTVVLFSVWTFGDLILWANDSPGTIMFIWSVLVLLEPLIYLCAFWFSHSVLDEKPLPNVHLLFFIILILPIILLASTSLMLQNFNLTNCWREVTEGPLVYYGYLVQVIIALSILVKTVVYSFSTTADKKTKARSILTTVAILLFLGVFSFGNIAGSFFENWTIGQYATFGMPVMIALIGLLISRYNAFHTNLFASQLLVAALAILTFSIIFVQNLSTVKIVSSVTFILVLILGTLLVRSIRKEIEQKQLAQNLATELAGANIRLEKLDKMKSEFVSIASHQLRSPLTSVRGYVSMVLEGSYGEVSDKVRGVLQHVADSAKNMSLSVEDYLNVSRIEAGNMKYEIANHDLNKITEDIVSEMLPVAVERGIPLNFKADFDGPAMVQLDFGKTRQIIQNLIDNAFKYTQGKGAIDVVLHKDDMKKMAYVDVIDHGIGVTPENLNTLFEKFERARNANDINVTGTGLGLYVARTMARAMKGDITVSSLGQDKGSAFTISFPLNGIESKWDKGGSQGK